MFDDFVGPLEVTHKNVEGSGAVRYGPNDAFMLWI